MEVSYFGDECVSPLREPLRAAMRLQQWPQPWMPQARLEGVGGEWGVASSSNNLMK